jgi:hypothetical protein
MDFLSTIFAILGLVIAIINYELDIYKKEDDFGDPLVIINEGKSAMDMPKFTDPWT